jgi:hypothetical protein
MRAAQPSAGCAARTWRRTTTPASGGAGLSAAAAVSRPVALLPLLSRRMRRKSTTTTITALRRRPNAATSATEAASTTTTTTTTTTTPSLPTLDAPLQLLPHALPPAPTNPRPPPAASAAAYGSLALAHAISAALLAALSLTQGAPLASSFLALGPASSVLAPALGACLAAASARAAGLCLFVRSAALAAEGGNGGGDEEKGARRRLRSGSGQKWQQHLDQKQQQKQEKASAATPTTGTTADDNDVTAARPLPTELRTWRYQRPNAALLAFGALSAVAHLFGLATAALSSSSSFSSLALALPLLGLLLSTATAAVSAQGLKWATTDAARQAGGIAASGALAGVAFACEPLAEALGGAEDVREDRELAAAAAAEAAAAARAGVAAALASQRASNEQEGAEGAGPRAATASTSTSSSPSADAALRAVLAHLARDATTLQGLALTACWVSGLGALAASLLGCLLPLGPLQPLPAVAAAWSVLNGGGGGGLAAAILSDPALAYLLFAAGVAALPALAGSAHALCEPAAYTRRLDIPSTLRASLLAKLAQLSRARRVARGRVRLAGGKGLLLPAPPAAAGQGAEVVDVRLEGEGQAAALERAEDDYAPSSSSSSSPQPPRRTPLFPPPPHNAPPSRFASLRLSFAAASLLQLLGVVAIGASTSSAPLTTLSDPRFVAAQAAAHAALNAADPSVAALHWAALLSGVWLSGQALGVDFYRLRTWVREAIDLVSRVIDLVVRGLYWDAWWILQDRVAH